MANVGDSRCVMGYGGKCKVLSTDHKTSLELEKLRVLKAGLKVIDGKVEGNLSITRALGDLKYKNQTLEPAE